MAPKKTPKKKPATKAKAAPKAAVKKPMKAKPTKGGAVIGRQGRTAILDPKTPAGRKALQKRGISPKQSRAIMKKKPTIVAGSSKG